MLADSTDAERTRELHLEIKANDVALAGAENQLDTVLAAQAGYGQSGVGFMGFGGTVNPQFAAQAGFHALVAGLNYSVTGFGDTNLQMGVAQTLCLRAGPGVYVGAGTNAGASYRSNTDEVKVGDISGAVGGGVDYGWGFWGVGGQVTIGVNDTAVSGAKARYGYGGGVSVGVDFCVTKILGVANGK